MPSKLATIRPILTVEDICELLRISHAQFYELKAKGVFDELGLLVPIEPPLDRRPRYSGEPFERWLESKTQQRALLARLRAGDVMSRAS